MQGLLSRAEQKGVSQAEGSDMTGTDQELLESIDEKLGQIITMQGAMFAAYVAVNADTDEARIDAAEVVEELKKRL